MTELLVILSAVLAGVATVAVPYTVLLRAERRRVDDLLAQLRAEAAPATYYATAPGVQQDIGEWIASPDGLIVERIGDA